MISKVSFYSFVLDRVIDGDSIVGTIHYGFKGRNVSETDVKIRVYGINAPEKTGETRKQGLITKSIVESLLINTNLVIRAYKTDSFGRILAEVFYEDENKEWQNLSTILVEQGYAVPYKG